MNLARQSQMRETTQKIGREGGRHQPAEQKDLFCCLSLSLHNSGNLTDSTFNTTAWIHYLLPGGDKPLHLALLGTALEEAALLAAGLVHAGAGAVGQGACVRPARRRGAGTQHRPLPQPFAAQTGALRRPRRNNGGQMGETSSSGGDPSRGLQSK